jgi:flagellar protein FlaJ
MKKSVIAKLFSNKTFLIILVASAVVTALIFAIDFLLFISDLQLFSTISIVAVITFAFPMMLFIYADYKKKREVEELFPIFLRDFVESVRSGLTLPQSFKSLRENDYKALTPYIKKIASQLDWGIPVEKVLLNFAKETESKLIGRIVSSVVESHRFGGNFADTFEALSSTAIEVDRLRQERRLYLQSQLITGYIIFFVFLMVIIGLGKFLVPSLSEVSAAGLGTSIGGASAAPTASSDLAGEYKVIFRNLIMLQGLFAGLAVGKLAEGSIISGIKHSLIMVTIGIVVFTIFG